MNALVRETIDIWHIIKGRPVCRGEVSFNSGNLAFRTPKLDLGELTWTRLEPCPAAHLPSSEIIDLLAETGKAVAANTGGFIGEAIDQLAATSAYARPVLERMFADMHPYFDPDHLRTMVEFELGGFDVLDSWRTVGRGDATARVHAYPPRTVHVLAGNAPIVATMTIARVALTKGVGLLKLASNDLFTAPAVLRTMAHIAPDHPLVRSFSAVYWRGGDERVESALFRAQFFDKLVAWGGDAAIRGSIKYLTPGFELISFDPKNSITMIGKEAGDSPENMAVAAVGAAEKITMFNQEACASTRFVYAEGTTAQVDKFCEALLPELGKARPEIYADARSEPVPQDLQEEISVLKQLAPEYRVWGEYDGRGMVVRSDEPVDFYPTNRVVNVVRVDDLSDALRWVNVSTQSVSIYPKARISGLVDGLANGGAQAISPLGEPGKGPIAGAPHDGIYPLPRMMRWVERRD